MKELFENFRKFLKDDEFAYNHNLFVDFIKNDLSHEDHQEYVEYFKNVYAHIMIVWGYNFLKNLQKMLMT